uniref:USP8 dimerisation domain-containing protein n=1 Tax=Compsopogon caeruleus TaxID=31354 RepID=A0A7S1TBX2_9RHOD|mmetsp:Transcript_15799/g.31743  ORF Transcript_15799/g.31743 Transcript_15799/m.31743 type:complete len:602 (+) Transcript_15799:234-2039(+)
MEQLFEKSPVLNADSSISILRYKAIADQTMEEASERVSERDWERAALLYMRVAQLIVRTVPGHPDYEAADSQAPVRHMRSLARMCFDHLEDLSSLVSECTDGSSNSEALHSPKTVEEPQKSAPASYQVVPPSPPLVEVLDPNGRRIRITRDEAENLYAPSPIRSSLRLGGHDFELSRHHTTSDLGRRICSITPVSSINGSHRVEANISKERADSSANQPNVGRREWKKSDVLSSSTGPQRLTRSASQRSVGGKNSRADAASLKFSGKLERSRSVAQSKFADAVGGRTSNRDKLNTDRESTHGDRPISDQGSDMDGIGVPRRNEKFRLFPRSNPRSSLMQSGSWMSRWRVQGRNFLGGRAAAPPVKVEQKAPVVEDISERLPLAQRRRAPSANENFSEHASPPVSRTLDVTTARIPFEAETTIEMHNDVARVFEKISRDQVARGLKTIGILACKVEHLDSDPPLHIAALIIPQQQASSDETVELLDEKETASLLRVKGLVTIGWITTALDQFASLSMHEMKLLAAVQVRYSQAFAVMLAPNDSKHQGLYALTEEGMIYLIRNPSATISDTKTLPPLVREASHVRVRADRELSFKIYDLRGVR